MKIKPLSVEVKHEEDGTPYLHYIGEYFFNEKRFVVDIPHMDLVINDINITKDVIYHNSCNRIINANINLAEKDGMLFTVTTEEEEKDCFIW